MSTMAMAVSVGQLLQKDTKERIKAFSDMVEEHFLWIDEVLIEAKKSFSVPDIQLLPKTPSAKRKRKGAPKVNYKEASEDEEDQPPKKMPSRTRGPRKGKNQSTEESEVDTATPDVSEQSDTCSSQSSLPSSRGSRVTRSKSSQSSRKCKEQKNEDAPVFNMNASVCESIKEEDEEPIALDGDSDDMDKGGKKNEQGNTQNKDENKKDKIMNLPDKPERTPKSKALPKTPNSGCKSSPKPIPGFCLLNVKNKAHAYEDMVNKSSDVSLVNSSVDERYTPKKKNMMEVILGGKNNESSTPEDHSIKTPQTPSTVVAHDKRTANTSVHTPGACEYTKTAGQSVVDDNKCHTKSAEPISSGYSSRRSTSKRRSRVSVGPRKSLSQRRSSARREKIRTSLSMKAASIAHGVAKQRWVDQVAAVNASGQDSPEQPQKSKIGLHHQQQQTTGSSSSDENGPRTPEAPKRVTRSKLRVKPAPAKLPTPSTDDDHDDAPTPVRNTDSSSDEKPARTTRSKMRIKPAPPKLPTPSSDDDVATPTRDTVGYQPPSTMGPARTTRSKMRHWQQTTQVGSPYTQLRIKEASKRFQSQKTDAVSPPKKQKTDTDDAMSCEESQPAGQSTPINSPTEDSSDGEVILMTPSPKHHAKILKPVQMKSFLTQLKKKPEFNSSANLNGTVFSFIQRNTPTKKTEQQKLAAQRKELEEKEKKNEDRLKKRQEFLQKKADEQKRRREERQMQAAKRREEHLKKEQEMRKGIAQKLEHNKQLTAKAKEDKVKEEKEKQKQRERKLAEAEDRRKREEEIRQQKILEQEEEQKRHEEMLARKREFEEQERQRKIAEQRKQQEEKLAELEKERQKELERIKQLQEQREQEEREKQRQREEREKKEKMERERAELERQKERERQKQEELEHQRELERQRLKEEAAEKQRQKEEEKRAKAMIEKHNNRVVSANTSLNTSSSGKPANTSLNKSNLNTTSCLNTSAAKDPNPDSYEITPVKNRTNSTEENYDIADLHSDDSTDDEGAPRKKIPNWATGASLKAALINQHYRPPDLDSLFEKVCPPDLNIIFKKRKPRFNKRTSSAIWDSPILKP